MGDQVLLWDVATGKQIGRPLSDSTGTVTSVAFSPDGRTLASASASGGFTDGNDWSPVVGRCCSGM